jgi:argininosuccinate lyase
MKMWSGRFRQPLDPEFERWQRSFEFDRRLLHEELAASRAHAGALKNAGVLSSGELIAILQGLDQIAEKAAASSAFLEDDEAEDVHHFVEKKLVALIGDTGYRLHSGRSRNEQIATDLRLYVRAAIDQLRSDLADFLGAFLDRAEQTGNAAMPAYTHLQRAEPVLLGHWLLAYVEMFLRDGERLADCRKRLNVCPLGSGAVAGATLSLDRRAMALELGFDAPTSNSIDATSDRDFVLEFVNVLSLLAMHLSRWAEEMVLFSSQEYGFVRLPEAYSTGSSAMPQKMNADLLELTRGKAARMIGDATALLVTMKGLPLAYNKDLQETQQPLFNAAETVRSLVPLVSGWMKAVEFNHDRMQEAAESGFMNAWAGATYLARQGVPFRMAHEQIGKAVQMCIERKCELADLPLEELRQLNPAFDQDFYSSLSLQAVLNIHDVPGGTAPARVRQALTDARKKVESLREGIHAHA